MYEGYRAPPGLEELVSASGKFCLLYDILPKLHLAGHRYGLFLTLDVRGHLCTHTHTRTRHAHAHAHAC